MLDSSGSVMLNGPRMCCGPPSVSFFICAYFCRPVYHIRQLAGCGHMKVHTFILALSSKRLSRISSTKSRGQLQESRRMHLRREERNEKGN